MSKILSQEEIDALLTSSADIERAARAENATRARDAVIVYNFRRPDRVSKEQIRSLHFLHDRFARNVGTSLSAYPARGDRGDDRLGRAVRVFRVPDVAAGSDRVLRRRRCGRSTASARSS